MKSNLLLVACLLAIAAMLVVAVHDSLCQPPISEMPAPDQPRPIRPDAQEFVGRNPLAKVESATPVPYDSRWVQLLVIVEGTSGDRALIPYWLPRREFVDRFPPYIPFAGETWKTGTYMNGGQRRLRLLYRWSGDTGGTGSEPIGAEPPNVIGAGPPDKPSDASVDEFILPE